MVGRSRSDAPLPADAVALRPVLRAGRNCWRVSEAKRASALIDAEDYFAALDSSLRKATRSIVILGWNFDDSIRLKPRDPKAPRLGNLLRSLVEQRPELEIRILIWNLSAFHAQGATVPLLFGAPWQDHPRIRFRLDNPGSLYGSHHQKIVCVDDSVAFIGGIDLTVARWDTQAHAPDHPLRAHENGEPYEPVHDNHAVVDGDAARTICDVAKARWLASTGEPINCQIASSDAWPEGVAPDFRDVSVGISRTLPRRGLHRGTREIEALTLDMIRSARRTIYIEAQYFCDHKVGEALARRLAESDGPEIVAVVARKSHGYLESVVMDGNRDRMLRALKRADRHGRLAVFYPATVSEAGEQEIFVHSKTVIVDDRLLRIGSANLNRRSTGLDSECDMTIQASDEASRAGVRAVLARLVGEHVDAAPDVVAEVLEREGSLIRTIESLGGRDRRLAPLEIASRGPTRMAPGTRFIDPRGPLRLASLLAPRRKAFDYGRPGRAETGMRWYASTIMKMVPPKASGSR